MSNKIAGEIQRVGSPTTSSERPTPTAISERARQGRTFAPKDLRHARRQFWRQMTNSSRQGSARQAQTDTCLLELNLGRS